MEPKTTTLKDWLVARAGDPRWLRRVLIEEAERQEMLIADAIKGLRFPSDDDDIHIERGREASQALRYIFVAIFSTKSGAPLGEISIPEWMVGGQLPLPEPEEEEEPLTEEGRPWEELGLTCAQWSLPLRDILPRGRNATRIIHNLQRRMGTADISAGPVVQLFNKKGWHRRTVQGIGPGLLELLRSCLAAAGYPVPEPART